MKNKMVLVLALVIGMMTYAQQDRKLELDNESNLIAVTYYHDNGSISQKGFYTNDGKLQGQWFSYDQDGNKTVSANYNNGLKVGKWFFWNNGKLKEVDYSNNAIASVSERIQNSAVASND